MPLGQPYLREEHGAPMVESESKSSPVEALEEKLRLARSVWLRSKRYWLVLAVSFVVAGLSAWAAPRFLKPLYRSEVILNLQQRMESRALAGLQDRNESSWKERLREFLMSAPNLKELVEKERLDPERVAEVGMPRTIETLRQKISFSAGGETFVIGFSNHDPSIAQRAARRLGQQLVQEVSRQSRERIGSTRSFLEQQEHSLAEELRSADAAYAEFISQHPEFAPEDSPGALGRAALTREGSPLAAAAANEASVGALQRQAARLRKRLEQLSTSSNAPPPPPPRAKPQLTPESKAAIDVATQDVQRAARDYDALKSKYTDRHPDVVRARTQLVAAQAQLRRVKATAVTFTETAPPPPVTTQVLLPPAPNEEHALTRQLRQVEAAIQRGSARPQRDGHETSRAEDGARTIVGLETRWAEISRRREGLREQHEQMQSSLFSAIVLEKAQAVGGGTELVVAEPAYLPKLPLSRGPRRTAAAAAALVLVLGAGIMLGLGFLDQRVLTEWDLKRLDLAPIVVVVPALDPEKAPRHS
jgi:capsular polysaccharide biosynthesis protein